MNEQLLQEFLAKAEEMIDVLFGDVQDLRARHTEGQVRRELIDRLFRHVHTLKGSAAAAGLTAASEIAHEFETLLDAVRAGRVKVDPVVIETFYGAAEVIAGELRAAAVGGGGVRTGTSLMLIQQLRQLGAGVAADDDGGGGGGGGAAVGSSSRPLPDDFTAAVLSALPDDVARSLSEYEQHRLREATQEGASLFVISVDFAITSFNEDFRNLSAVLAKGGEIISTMTEMPPERTPERITFRVLYAAHENRDDLLKRLAAFDVTLVEAQIATERNDAAAVAASSPGAASLPRLVTASSPVSPDGEPNQSAPAAATPGGPPSRLVRVPLTEIDALISVTHELFADTSAALDAARAEARPDAPPDSKQAELETRAARIQRRFSELRGRLFELRMVPVGPTLERAARAGASVARAAGKEVDFEITGGEVRLDKSLADAVADPLLHILRNAVDHGIEAPAERLRAGKSERGRIRLEVAAEGSRMLLRIGDDGRGIDPQRITRAALECGLISAAARLTEQQCLRIIFRPGFSTAPEVSPVSGRGVGLDVVERAVEEIGGELRVFSHIGEGTTFEMNLPTTLAVVPSLIVRSADYRYCVDASHIVEVGHVAPPAAENGEIRRVRWRGDLVPFLDMRELLAQPRRELPKESIAVIIAHCARRKTDREEASPPQSARRVAAVAVDGWDEHSEVLVRGLGSHATRWWGVSGATELRDGTVALMLDLPRLLETHINQ